MGASKLILANAKKTVWRHMVRHIDDMEASHIQENINQRSMDEGRNGGYNPMVGKRLSRYI